MWLWCCVERKRRPKYKFNVATRFTHPNRTRAAETTAPPLCCATYVLHCRPNETIPKEKGERTTTTHKTRKTHGHKKCNKILHSATERKKQANTAAATKTHNNKNWILRLDSRARYLSTCRFASRPLHLGFVICAAHSNYFHLCANERGSSGRIIITSQKACAACVCVCFEFTLQNQPPNHGHV